MSYSSELKSQLTSSEIKSKCCASAELFAALLMNSGDVFFSADKNFIRRINALVMKSRESAFRKRIFYRKNKRGIFLFGTEVSWKETPEIQKLLRKPCCASAFLRGCFIRAGYITPPDQPARADISFKNEQAMQICRHALEQCGIHYNTTKRNGNDVVYIKSVESVSDFLARIGAVGAMLEFENSRIIKKYKNEVNRITNCDNANLDKTVSAAIRQTALISGFMTTAAFETLPEQLKEIARLRVENDSLSLKELGALLTPVLGKSGVAHRLKKIEDIANNVK